MLDEVVLQNQVKMSTASSLGQTVWVYRGSMCTTPVVNPNLTLTLRVYHGSMCTTPMIFHQEEHQYILVLVQAVPSIEVAHAFRIY